MKGRKHELNYPFDPAAVSDPACWLPVALTHKIPARFPRCFRIEPPRFKEEGVLDASGQLSEATDGTLHFHDDDSQPA